MLPYHEKYRLFYETAFQLQRREVELLFQRLNFFLVSTAFLIAAFSTVVVAQHSWLPRERLLWLAHLICAAGFYLAFFFSITNFLNTRAIRQMGEYIRGLENGNYAEPPHIGVQRRLENLPTMVHQLALELAQTLWTLFSNAFDFSKRLSAPHTWLIPIGFSIFWVIVWFMVIPSPQIPLQIASQIFWVPVPVIPTIGTAIPFIFLLIVELVQLAVKR